MKLLCTIIALGFCGSVLAQGTQLSSSATETLDVTNINARVLNGGDFFWDLSNSRFEVPRGSGKSTIFAGALWLGGKDNQNNLYVASQTYRQGSPFQAGYWPGPIAASQGPTQNTKYNKVWKVSQIQILNHIANYNKPGYTISPDIATWPGNGDVTNGEAAQLAPFIDLNNDGIYSPAQGDYPAIKGDQALYMIINDKGNVKVPASPAMNAEIHAMFYGFNNPADTAVYNTVFTHYRIINRGQTNFKDVYAGIWTDFDIGYYADDFVGCDTLNNRFYGYNGDNFDDGINGYGTTPPVQSVIFLDKQMSHFVYYNNNTNAVNGNPDNTNALHYYNYLSGKWKNNSSLTYGGDGTNPNNRPVSYMFAGDPVSQTGWSERNTLITPGVNTPADRRGIGSFGPFNLIAGQSIEFTVAYNFCRGLSNLATIPFSVRYVQRVQNFFNTTLIASTKPEKIKQPLLLFPNPVIDQLTIQLPSVFENKAALISITDNVGRKVIEKSVARNSGNQVQLNIEALSKGMYQVTVTSGEETITAKLAKL